MKLTKTKWVDHKFTKEQKQARAKWRRAQENVNDLTDALRLYPTGMDKFISERKKLHERLDRRLDVIEKTVDSARDLFPEVDESFTCFKGEL